MLCTGNRAELQRLQRESEHIEKDVEGRSNAAAMRDVAETWAVQGPAAPQPIHMPSLALCSLLWLEVTGEGVRVLATLSGPSVCIPPCPLVRISIIEPLDMSVMAMVSDRGCHGGGTLLHLAYARDSYHCVHSHNIAVRLL